MKTASITEAKNKLSALLKEVRAGESILILDRGVPVARIEPVTRAEDEEARLVRLERAGLVRRATKPVPRYLYETPPPKPRSGVSIVDVLLEERESGF